MSPCKHFVSIDPRSLPIRLFENTSKGMRESRVEEVMEAVEVEVVEAEQGEGTTATIKMILMEMILLEDLLLEAEVEVVDQLKPEREGEEVGELVQLHEVPEEEEEQQRNGNETTTTRVSALFRIS